MYYTLNKEEATCSMDSKSLMPGQFVISFDLSLELHFGLFERKSSLLS